MMRNLSWKGVHQGGLKMLLSMLFGLVVLATAGCGGDGDDAVIITEIRLPTDMVLNLSCDDVALYNPAAGVANPCVLDDGENPYRAVVIIEFDINDPDDLEPPFENKFDLVEEAAIAGPKALFYLWATAFARLAIGENEYGAARALHELWSEQATAGVGDPRIRQQALDAYRSVLDNFYIEATFFSSCTFFPGACPLFEELTFPVALRNLVGENLVLASEPDLMHLWAGAPFEETEAQDEMGEWGYGWDNANELTFRIFPGSP